MPLVFVDPRSTSIICLKCRAKLNYNHRLVICPRCGFTADRDTVGAMNIYLKVIQALAPRPGLWSNYSMMGKARLKSGSKDEPMPFI